MDTDTLDISKLSPGQLASIFSQLKALEQAQKDALKNFALSAAESALAQFETETFDSGAVGLYAHAKGPVMLPDGTEREVTVSLNVRFTDTIPARKTKA